MSTFIETEHPRHATGQFRSKDHSTPDGDLEEQRPVTFTGYDSVKDKVEAMRTELEEAVDRLADDDQWSRYLDVMSKFHHYSFQNQLLIAVQRPGATRVSGFRKWKEMGRSVRKGEKGISILAPRIVTRKDDNGDVITDDEGRPKRAIVGFTSATVFDVEQTEGEPLPVAHDELSETPPAGFQDDLEAAVAAEGFSVTYSDIPGGAKGFTAPGSKQVVVDASLTDAEKATTLAHELGHIMCGHVGDDEERSYSVGHGGKRGEMEVEAESFAYVLSRMNGMQTHQRAASTYVAGWQELEPDAIRGVGERLSKAFKRTMERKWQNVPAQTP